MKYSSIPLGLVFAFLLWGIFTTLIFVFVLKDAYNLALYGRETSGTINEYYKEISFTSNTPDLYVKFSFFAPLPGKTYDTFHPGELWFSSSLVSGHFEQENPVGSSIKVRYYPENPKLCYIKNGQRSADLIGNIFGLVVGLGFIGFSVAAFFVNRQRKSA